MKLHRSLLRWLAWTSRSSWPVTCAFCGYGRAIMGSIYYESIIRNESDAGFVALQAMEQ